MEMPKRHRILIVDDERINRKVLSELLEDSHDVILAKNAEQALRRIASDPETDLILLDVLMPDMDGYEVLRRLKAMNETKDIPVIFISMLGSAEDEEKGLCLGAADYIRKPFHPAIVRLRIENHLRFVRQRKMLEHLAGRDGLTEINNRRQFDTVFETEWQRAGRNELPLSLVMTDVDFFKCFNDHYGHASGDKVLKSVATILSQVLRRPADMVARYGGDEFVLLLPETNLSGAKMLAENARASVERLAISHDYSDTAPHVTISIGGVTTTEMDESPEKLLVTADAMLYKAKMLGRNRIVWYDRQTDTSAWHPQC